MNMTMSKAPEGPFSRVEVITSVQRRRRWSTAEKVRLVEEALQPGMSVSFVARQAGISPSQLFAWKRRMLEGGHADEDVVGTSRVRDLEKRVRDLERLLGHKTMENEILKEARDIARPKKTSLALAVLERAQGRFPVSAVAKTLGVARSHINERRGTAVKPQGPYRKAEALGLTLLFTPVRSPESNGMSEAFVKTLKRDYASINILADADTILDLLPGWIEDYCEVHPHSGLRFRSPREYLRLSA